MKIWIIPAKEGVSVFEVEMDENEMRPSVNQESKPEDGVIGGISSN